MSPPNDWQIKKCLGLSLAVLLVTLGLVGLTSVGLDVPVLSQVIGFVFLTFIPGVLLLRVLKVHNINIVESLLYSAGLSLAFDMTVGVVINFALPPLGIDRPITLCPLITCFGISLLILCALAYWRDRNYCPAAPQHEPIKKATTPGLMAGINPYLLAALLPLLAILGTGMANAYQNNLVLLGVILLVVIIIALAAFTRFIPPPAYAFTITMTALALLYQTSLTSDYLVGSDIHLERYFSRTVLESGYWDPAVPVAMNSCLSIVILAPLYSLVLNMDIVWLFKIVYPLLFCLVPLALYRIFRLQFQPRYAFFGAAFFICMPMFFMDMVQLARQQISELFFVLVILLLVDRRLTLTQRTALALVFSSGVIISHYGLGTGYTIGYLALGALVLIFIKSRSGRKAWQWLIGKSSPLPSDLTTAGAFTRAALAVVVCLSLAFMFGYYSVVASGKSLAGTRVLINVVATVSQPFVQHFTPQQEATMPPAPQNLRLARNESRTTCLTPRLEWDSLPGAASYWLQVATDKGFNNLIIDEGGISAAHYDIAAALERNTTYFWRVKALTGYGESDWSRVGRISTWPPTLAGRVKDALSSRTELPAFVQDMTARFPMLNSLTKEPLTQTALGFDFSSASATGKIWRVFQYLVQLCLIAGCFKLFLRPASLGRLKAEYLSLSIVSLLILLGIFILPAVSHELGVTRVWQITLLLMSPLFIFGGEAIAQGIARLIKRLQGGCASFQSRHNRLAFLRYPVLVILIPYFVFNSGVVFELTRSQTTHFIDVPYSIALSGYRVDVNTVFVAPDVAGAVWLSARGRDDYPIYADMHGRLAFPDYWGDDKGFRGTAERRLRMPPFPAQVEDMMLPCYIYFRSWNTSSRMLTFPTGYATRKSIGFDNIPGLTRLVDCGDRIYTNGGAWVLSLRQ